MAKVAGSCAERYCYRFLSLLAFLLFLASVAGIVFRASKPTTDVEIKALDVFPWPVMYYCVKHAAQADVHLRSFPKTAAEDGVDCGEHSAMVWSMDLGSDDVPTLECLAVKGSDESALARDLQNRFKAFSKTNISSGDDWKCAVLNEDGKLTSTPDVYKQVIFDWYSRAKYRRVGEGLLHRSGGVRAGILDPKLMTVAEQKDAFNYITIPLVNAFAEIAFSVDKHVTEDWSKVFTSTGATGAKQVFTSIGEMEAAEQVAEILKRDSVKLKYNPSVSIKDMSPFVMPPTLHWSQKSELERNRLVFAPLYHLSRTVTTRYKTWDELWSAIGGAWAMAVLLVSAFFVQKEVKVPPQHPEKQRRQRKGEEDKVSSKQREMTPEPEVIEPVQVFRLRGVTSKEHAAKAAWAMIADALDAGVQQAHAITDSRRELLDKIFQVCDIDNDGVLNEKELKLIANNFDGDDNDWAQAFESICDETKRHNQGIDLATLTHMFEEGKKELRSILAEAQKLRRVAAPEAVFLDTGGLLDSAPEAPTQNARTRPTKQEFQFRDVAMYGPGVMEQDVDLEANCQIAEEVVPKTGRKNKVSSVTPRRCSSGSAEVVYAQQSEGRTFGNAAPVESPIVIPTVIVEETQEEIEKKPVRGVLQHAAPVASTDAKNNGAAPAALATAAVFGGLLAAGALAAESDD